MSDKDQLDHSSCARSLTIALLYSALAPYPPAPMCGDPKTHGVMAPAVDVTVFCRHYFGGAY